MLLFTKIVYIFVKTKLIMGLDNGIIIKDADKIKDDLVKCPCFKWDETDETYGYQHIAYWRKCWGIRGAILKVLHVDDNSGGGDYPIEHDDVPAILRAIKPFLKRSVWDEEADSIWEYDEILDEMIDIYIRLTWLADYMKSHKDLKVYFYDSY